MFTVIYLHHSRIEHRFVPKDPSGKIADLNLQWTDTWERVERHYLVSADHFEKNRWGDGDDSLVNYLSTTPPGSTNLPSSHTEYLYTRFGSVTRLRLARPEHG
jgi:hypothetical protein